MGEVVTLPCSTSLDLPAGRVLQAAIDSGLQTALVIGLDAEGQTYLASSTADSCLVLMLLRIAEGKTIAAYEANQSAPSSPLPPGSIININSIPHRIGHDGTPEPAA